jgi:hypothetical protein
LRAVVIAEVLHAGEQASGDPGVEGNHRLTAATGAVIFVLLAVEGVTVPSVSSLLTLHVFVGAVLVPIVALKVATTMYRFARYYRRDPAYVRKGPPNIVLRLLGPVVTVLTISLLGTGIVLIIAGRSHREPWLTLHQLSFYAWIGVMTVHVLGHIIETARVARRDYQPRAGRQANVRRGALALAVVAGLGFGLALRGRVDDWRQERGGDRHGLGVKASR